MNLLLTGGTGYIASHAAVVLAADGHEIVLYDNLCNSSQDVVERLELIAKQRMTFVKGDVRNTGLLIQSLEEHAIDAVIHFAGLKAVGDSVEKPIEYYANNIQGMISLLQAMQSSKVKTLVFSSSATVYGDPQYLPIDENHPTSATNPYGRCKLHIEEILADIANSDNSWRIICLRYFNPVGAHHSGLIGEDAKGIPNNLMPYIAGVASGKYPYLRIFGSDYPTPDGTGVRDYIHVMDLAEGHLAALDYLGNKTGWNAINLGTGRGYSVLEMVKAFEQVAEQSIAYQMADRRCGDIATCYAKVDTAAKELGWKARRGLEDMCQTTWNFILKES
jgi:UDP-glucose 4-epimerase